MDQINDKDVVRLLRDGHELLRSDGVVIKIRDDFRGAEAALGRRLNESGWTSMCMADIGVGVPTISFAMYVDMTVAEYDRGFLDGYNRATRELTTPKVHPSAVEALAAQKSCR